MENYKRSPTFRILYYWGKILGLNPLNLSDNNEVEFSHFGLIHGFLLGTAYTYIFYRVIEDRSKSSLPGETPIAVMVFFIWICTRFLETLLTWLAFALYQNRIKFIVTNFIEAEMIARELGIPENYEKDFRRLGARTAITNILYIAALGLTLAELGRYSNFHTGLWIAYDMPRIASVNMEVLFIWSLSVVDERFHRLNEKLRVLVTSNCRNANKALKKRRARLPSQSRYGFSERITMISKMHRLLRDTVCLIKMHFAVLVLFGITTHFTHLTLNIYLAYRSAKIHGSMNGADFTFMSPLGCWLLASLVALTTISNVCGSVSNKANATGNILHAMLNDCEISSTIEETAKFHMLSLDLLNNRLSISIYGFFELNHFFIYSTLTTATTYVVIMLQLYG